MSTERSLGDSFSQYFEIVPALTDATREDVFHIRHEVYCRDLGWEPLRENGLETDAYDRQSVHLLMRHRASGMLVGCTRLVLTDPLNRASPLPFERSCAEVLNRQIIDPALLARERIGEISRLAVMREFRQRKGEQRSALAMSDDDFEARGPQSRFPFIPVGLYMGVAALALHLGLHHVFVLTEPRLAAHFARIGIGIEPIGGTIEHRGTRSPWLMRGASAMSDLRPAVRSMFEQISQSVAQAYAAKR